MERQEERQLLASLRRAIGRSGTVEFGGYTYGVVKETSRPGMTMWPPVEFLVRADAEGNHVALEQFFRPGQPRSNRARIRRLVEKEGERFVAVTRDAAAATDTAAHAAEIAAVLQVPLLAEARRLQGPVQTAISAMPSPDDASVRRNVLDVTASIRDIREGAAAGDVIANVLTLRNTTIPALRRAADTLSGEIARRAMLGISARPAFSEALAEGGYTIDRQSAEYQSGQRTTTALLPAISRGGALVHNLPSRLPADPTQRLVAAPQPSETAVLAFLADAARFTPMIEGKRPDVITPNRATIDLIKRALGENGTAAIDGVTYATRPSIYVTEKGERGETSLLYVQWARDPQLPRAINQELLADWPQTDARVSAVIVASQAETLGTASVQTRPNPECVRRAVEAQMELGHAALENAAVEYAALRDLLVESGSKQAARAAALIDADIRPADAGSTLAEVVESLESVRSQALQRVRNAVLENAPSIAEALSTTMGMSMQAKRAGIALGYRTMPFPVPYETPGRGLSWTEQPLLTYTEPGGEPVPQEVPPLEHPAMPNSRLSGEWPRPTVEGAMRLARTAVEVQRAYRGLPSPERDLG